MELFECFVRTFYTFSIIYFISLGHFPLMHNLYFILQLTLYLCFISAYMNHTYIFIYSFIILMKYKWTDQNSVVTDSEQHISTLLP